MATIILSECPRTGRLVFGLIEFVSVGCSEFQAEEEEKKGRGSGELLITSARKSIAVR